MENERNMRGNECKMKGDERKKKQKMTFVLTLDQGCSHPQQAGNFTLIVYRELTTCKQNDKSKKKR